MFRRAKIVATVGPASEPEELLWALMEAGRCFSPEFALTTKAIRKPRSALWRRSGFPQQEQPIF